MSVELELWLWFLMPFRIRDACEASIIRSLRFGDLGVKPPAQLSVVPLPGRDDRVPQGAGRVQGDHA